MKRLLLLCIVVASSSPLLAQLYDPKGYSKASAAYRQYRYVTTTPSYGLAKVQRLIKRIKPKAVDDDSTIQAVSQRAFNALTTKEKFTYCMLQAEMSRQSCDGMPGFINEETLIFAQSAHAFEADEWSDRQTKFMEKHRDEIIRLLRTTIKSHHRVGANLKDAILELDAWELIPDMPAIYRSNGKDKDKDKDKDILSVFCQLMKEAEFKTFLNSAICYKLYSDEDASYKSFVRATPANQHVVIADVLAFYQSNLTK